MYCFVVMLKNYVAYEARFGSVPYSVHQVFHKLNKTSSNNDVITHKFSEVPC